MIGYFHFVVVVVCVDLFYVDLCFVLSFVLCWLLFCVNFFVLTFVFVNFFRVDFCFVSTFFAWTFVLC